MLKIKSLILITILSCLILSCDMYSAGHGGFTTYSFETKKRDLEIAVMKVIATDTNIYREPEASQEYKDIYKKNIEEKNKELKNGFINPNYVDYYNDGINYITIKIKDKDCEFTFRYIGDVEYWNSSPNSQFYIVYLHNRNNKGGGYYDKLDPQFIKQLTDVFELELVKKVSKELNIPFTKKE